MCVKKRQVCKTLNTNTVDPKGPDKEDLVAMNARQKQWVVRKSAAGSSGQVWRVPRLHRRSVVATIRNIDAQLMRSTCWAGLKQILYNEKDPTWAPGAWKDSTHKATG